MTHIFRENDTYFFLLSVSFFQSVHLNITPGSQNYVPVATVPNSMPNSVIESLEWSVNLLVYKNYIYLPLVPDGILPLN